MKLSKKIRDKIASGDIIKIDIGGGIHPQAGYISMDAQRLPGVDVVHNWDDLPWPFPDACATVIMASHVVEHVNPANFGFVKWMNECWRILKVGGQLVIAAPYAGSPGFWADPTHINGVTEHTFLYFNPDHMLWNFYKPKPWTIQNCYIQVEGNLEVLMVKRGEVDGDKKVSKRKG